MLPSLYATLSGVSLRSLSLGLFFSVSAGSSRFLMNAALHTTPPRKAAIKLAQCLIFVVTFGVTIAAQGEHYSPFRTVVRGSLETLKRQGSANLSLRTSDGLLRVRLSKVSLGRGAVVLENRVVLAKPSSRFSRPLLYQGGVYNSSGTRVVRAAADITGAYFRIYFVGPRSGASFAVSGVTATGVARVSRVSRRARFACRVIDPLRAQRLSSASPPPLSPVGRALSPLRTLSVDTESDHSFYLQYGARSLAKIQSMLNAVDAQYAQQLGVRLKLLRHSILSASSARYTSTSSEAVLYQFQDEMSAQSTLGTADVAHLFLGHELSEGVLGIAFVAGACEVQNTLNVGLSARTSMAKEVLVLAHEIGHNLGAHHPEEYGYAGSSLMSGVVYSHNTAFSAFSIGEIESFIESEGSCLAPAS